MTNQQRITTIQLQEALAYLEFKICESKYDTQDPKLVRAYTTHNCISRLMHMLDITADETLPANQAAFKIRLANRV